MVPPQKTVDKINDVLNYSEHDVETVKRLSVTEDDHPKINDEAKIIAFFSEWKKSKLELDELTNLLEIIHRHKYTPKEIELIIETHNILDKKMQRLKQNKE